jgi:hypothetical protein
LDPVCKILPEDLKALLGLHLKRGNFLLDGRTWETKHDTS